LDLVLLVLDIKMIKDLLLFGFSDVGVVVLSIELALPKVDLGVLLLNQLDEVLILLHEMGVLGKQQLDLLLEVVDLLVLPHLEDQLLVQRHQLALQLPRLRTPVLRLPRRPVARRRVVAHVRTTRVRLVGRVVLPAPQVADWASSHIFKMLR